MTKSPPWGLRWRSSTFFIISTVGIGLFTDLFLYGLVVPVLPFLLRDRVHLPQDEIQSNVSGLLAAYAGTSFLFSPPAGILADRLPSRQLPFLAGLVALLLATSLLFVGESVSVLVLARALQGISAAVVWTIGLALTLDTVGPENLGKTIGSIFGFISVGELAAPVLGGVVYKNFGYVGVFLLSFAILAVDIIMRLLLIEKKVAARYDPLRSDGSTERHVPQEEGEDDHNEGEAGEEQSLLGKENDCYKVPPDQPRPIRLYPILYCLRDPRLLTAFLLTFGQATLLGAFDATVPTEAQDLFGFDSLKAGLLFIPLILPYLALGPVAGWSVDRYGTKPAAVVGFGFLVPTLIFLRLACPGGTPQVVLYCALLALCGLGLAMISSPSIVEASYVVQMYNKVNPDFFGANGPYAQLFGISSMVFSAGSTIGPLVGGSLRDAVGYGNMNIVMAALCLITAVLSYVYVGGKPSKFWTRR